MILLLPKSKKALEKIFPDVVLDMMRMDPDFDEEEIREILYQYLSKNGGDSKK